MDSSPASFATVPAAVAAASATSHGWRGRRDDNRGCHVCRFEDGLMRELTECMDTELAAAVLGAPERRPGP